MPSMAGSMAKTGNAVPTSEKLSTAHKEQVLIDTLTESHDIQELRSLIEEHVAATGSPRGKKILAAFKSYIPCFKKVMPRDYDRMLRSIAQYEEKGMSRAQAEIEAFYANTKV